MQQIDCFVCNQQGSRAAVLWTITAIRLPDDVCGFWPHAQRQHSQYGGHHGRQGAVYARANGSCGMPAKKVDVIDTTGAGDAFFAGTVIGLTYGKNAGRILRDRQPSCCFGSSASPRTSNVPASARRSSGWTYRWWTDDLNGVNFCENPHFPLDRSGSFWYQ